MLFSPLYPSLIPRGLPSRVRVWRTRPPHEQGKTRESPSLRRPPNLFAKNRGRRAALFRHYTCPSKPPTPLFQPQIVCLPFFHFFPSFLRKAEKPFERDRKEEERERNTVQREKERQQLMPHDHPSPSRPPSPPTQARSQGEDRQGG
eukprot:Hpha_TRINITY_DN16175_c3_g1::TRINITY_DN16175_c3_g1_i1::g.6832::m.6832